LGFQLEQDTPVNLSVYDLIGKSVTVLKNGMAQKGKHTMVWDAAAHPSGVYFYKFEAAGFQVTKKMILVR
jgi:hypothetical protein